jgi:hypothetical protein
VGRAMAAQVTEAQADDERSTRGDMLAKRGDARRLSETLFVGSIAMKLRR